MYSYNNKNINYEIYNNLSNIDNINNKIIKELKEILEETNIVTKNKKINDLNYKIKNNEMHKEYRKEINLIYKYNNGLRKNIFGDDFVENNKNIIKLNINGDDSDLVSKLN